MSSRVHDQFSRRQRRSLWAKHIAHGYPISPDRVQEDSRFAAELNSFADRTIDVPACYIGGDSDWATYQAPGAFKAMHSACTRLLAVHRVSVAGHSIAEEQPEAVNRLLSGFLRQLAAA